jgi:hypothetical protein
MSFIPIEKDHESSLSSSLPSYAIKPLRSLSTTLVRAEPAHRRYKPKTIHVITLSEKILSEIDFCRREFRKGVLTADISKALSMIDENILKLSATIKKVEHSIKMLKKEKDYQKCTFDILSQEVVFSLITKNRSLANALIDTPGNSVQSRLERKICNIQQEDSFLQNALLSLSQYKKIFQAYQDAKDDGIPLPETIHIPTHLRDIQNRIFFLGENFTDFLSVGEGGWGIVKRCYLGKKPYAIKSSKQRSPFYQDFANPDQLLYFDNNCKRDIFIPLILNHPNIIKLCGVFNDQPVLEYIKEGSLTNFLGQQNYLTDNQSVDILFQIASALLYMHSLGIIHKDIKCDNILLESLGQSYRAVIIDFGTTVSEKSKDVGNFSGSPIFMSPEMLAYLANNRRSLRKLFLEAPITKAVDIWGLGHIIYQIVAGGRELFPERKIGKSTKTSQNIKPCTGPASITYSIKETFSKDYLLESCLKSQKKTKSGVKDPKIRDQLLDLASSCLRKNFENRPSIIWLCDQLRQLKETTS